METGNSTLLITPENIHECLNKLVEISPQKTPNSLHFLLLVDLYVALNTHLPPTPQRRYDALNHILTSFITGQYRHHRTTRNLVVPTETDLHQQEALTFIAEEGLKASVELLSWSWLYYHFVRVDLSIDYSTFCKHAHIDKRTLRRYQQHGIQRLTDYLSEREGEARKEQRQRWMYLHLPRSIYFLFGRDDLLKQAEYVLKTSSSAHIQINGASGIGKTTFAGVIAKNQIDAGFVDRFVWIRQPKSVEHMRQFLCEQVLPEGASISIGEYALLQRLLVVVDDMGNLQRDSPALVELLDELSSAQVILISPIYIALPRVFHFPLKELSQEQIYAVLNHLSGKEDALNQDRVAYIWERCGGNPAAAILMLRHWPLDTTLPPKFVHDPLLHAYAALEHQLKTAWLSFVLLPPVPQDLQSIIRLWSGKISETQLQYLLQHHLLEVFEDDSTVKCCLSTLARHFIEDRYVSDLDIQHLLNDLLKVLAVQPASGSKLLCEAVEHILLSNWLQIDDHIRETWIQQFCEEDLQRDHAAQWSVILKPYADDAANPYLFKLQINYGVCLRRVSQWKESETIFERVSHDAGRAGQFLEQCYALIEWATLLEHQGKYKKALELLGHVESTLSRYSNQPLLYKLRVVQTQIALDIGDIDNVDEFIHSLPETPQTLVLWCESLLLKCDYRALHRTFQKIKPILQERSHDYARIEVVIGRSYQQMYDFENAYQHLYAALSIVEKEGDVFATARIRSNLGAVMIDQGAYRDARLVLDNAETMQKQLKDQSGLAVTQHNIRLLKRKVVS